MLPITEYPSFVRESKGYLKSAFSNWRQVENAMRYLSGLIVLPERRNVSSINRSFVKYRNQVSMNHFLTNSTWDDNEFHRAVVRMVKDEVKKPNIKHGTLLIDDTFFEKTGEEMEGAGWFWDHTQYKSIIAHNVVSTHYITGKVHVPLDFDVYVKRKDCADKKQFRTKVEIAKDVVEKAVRYGLPIDVVVFDS
jgi:SRSO17 transposase